MSEFLQGIASLTKTVQQTLNSYEVRKLGDKVQGYVLNFTETEQKVREATNEDPWGPTGPEMQEIASLTFQYDQFTELMGMLWKRLLQDNKVAWRRVYKSLILLNHLLRNGSERVISIARDHMFELRALESYKCLDERGKDEGANVRHRVKLILELLNDDELLRTERRKAKSDGREKYQGFSKDDMLFRGGTSKVDSFERWNEKKKQQQQQSGERGERNGGCRNSMDFGGEQRRSEEQRCGTGGGGRREVTAFDFDNGHVRSQANGSPELGIREHTPELLEEEDDDFGDFTSARANNSSTSQVRSTSSHSSPPVVLKMAATGAASVAYQKPANSGGTRADVDLLGLGDFSVRRGGGGSSLVQKVGGAGGSLFDAFPEPQQQQQQQLHQLENIIFIDRPKSQQQQIEIQQQLTGAASAVNLSSSASGSTTAGTAPVLLDLFSSSTQPAISAQSFAATCVQKSTKPDPLDELLSSNPPQKPSQPTPSVAPAPSSNKPKLPKTWEDFEGKVNIDFENLSLNSPTKAQPSLNELKKSASGGPVSSTGRGLW